MLQSMAAASMSLIEAYVLRRLFAVKKPQPMKISVIFAV